MALSQDPGRYKLRGLQGKLINEIGAAIVSGRFAPGAVLREDELMAGMGASRVSIREAVKVLAAKGLVETRQRSGTRVLDRNNWNMFDADVLDWHDLDAIDNRLFAELIELRLIVEPQAARLAASRVTEADLAQLDAACAAMNAATSDTMNYARADVSFHIAMLAASGNSLLSRFAHIIASFLQASFRVQQEALPPGKRWLKEDWKIHVRMLEAVRAGDAELAESLMRNAIEDGRRSLERARGIGTLGEARPRRLS
ncbi:MAG TPA: FadR/GntR family transcriptional regulator [Acidisoma sp.]|jgi:DNA-binding FadR family transcriptional regulator|nr:FadR/GntR family transcriptional regulator [Acidisoma sp.]